MNTHFECFSDSSPSNPSLIETDSDVFLVKQTCAGDQTAFTKLWNRYRQKLYRILYFMVRHEEDSWDLLQETFIKAYKSLPGLKNAQIFGSWVTKIAMNLAINHLKKKERIRKAQEYLLMHFIRQPEESPHRVLEQQESADRLQELIQALPPKQRSVLILSDIEGHTYKEIAEILQCRIGTVMSRLFYARNFIRNQLGSSLEYQQETSHASQIKEDSLIEDEWESGVT